MMLKRTALVGGRAWLALGTAAILLASCDEDDEISIAAPYNLVAYPCSDTQVYVSWVPASSNHEGFHVYRDGGSGFVEVADLPESWWGYYDTDVTIGTVYTYYVVAYAGSTNSPQSNQASVEAGAPYCDILTPTSSDTLTVGDTFDITWTTNDPVFDAQIKLSLDGGTTYPHTIQGSWAPNGSPYTWKVGYRNTEPDPTLPPIWGEQVIMAYCDQCKIRIYSYEGPAPTTGISDTFTVDVP